MVGVLFIDCGFDFCLVSCWLFCGFLVSFVFLSVCGLVVVWVYFCGLILLVLWLFWLGGLSGLEFILFGVFLVWFVCLFLTLVLDCCFGDFMLVWDTWVCD